MSTTLHARARHPGGDLTRGAARGGHGAAHPTDADAALSAQATLIALATHLDLAATDGIRLLQRSGGNRAVATLLDGRARALPAARPGHSIQRQGPPSGTGGATAGAGGSTTAAKPTSKTATKAKAKSTPKAEKPKPSRLPTKDEVAQAIDTSLGGPYKTWADWAKTMKAGKFLGHEIGSGVRPEFQALLDTAKTKIDEEYKKSGNPVPKDYGITSVGGFREEISPHGAGFAIDIDAAANPYVMHEGAGSAPGYETTLDKGQKVVYHRIAELMLNDPIDGEQSIIPKLITTGDTVPKGTTATRRERLGQYWDRLKRESDAMKDYFRLMTDRPALEAYLKGDWAKLHPDASVPDAGATIAQMWADYALLGGAIPKAGVPEAPGVKGKGVRPPFHPKDWQQLEPAAGFLTIPREVAVGLGQAVGRWGAIDFGVESGDVMHFDDKSGLAKPFYAAMQAVTDRIIEADQRAKEEAEKAKASAEAAKAAGQGRGAGPTPSPPGPAPAPSAAEGVQRSVQRQAIAGNQLLPIVQRQPPPAPPGPAAPGHRPGEAWPFGPTSQFKSITVNLATFTGWIHEAEAAYGVDKETALQRLRRIYYSSYSGKAGTKFDRAIEAEQGGHEPPLDIRVMSPRAVDGLYATDAVVTPAGQTLDVGHILAELDLAVSGASYAARVGEAAYDIKMAGVVTWTGDLASWFLEWTQEVKKIHSTPPPPSTGPATNEGPPSEVGGDPAMDPALWERIGASKASKEDLLGDIDAQIMTASSAQLTTAESRKREERWAERELTAPVSALLEQYYGLAGGSAAGGTRARTAPDADRFAAFLRLAVPPIPHDEVNGNVSLASGAEDTILDEVTKVARMFLEQGTSASAAESEDLLRMWHSKLREIARRFTRFLEEGLKHGDAPWP